MSNLKGKNRLALSRKKIAYSTKMARVRLTIKNKVLLLQA